ncbi:MAG: PKD domain-containing protein, partial [Thermoplasmata archaeon]|nr:PKD domain-containing protein [Thermoplasmata archaeon]
TFTVTLTVRDAAGNEASDEMEVRVNDITAPVPDPGEDRTVDQGSQVQLDGSGSTDNVGIEMHVWKFEYDDMEEQLDGALQTYTFQIPGEYTIQLTVTDAADNHAAGSFDLTVRDTIDPVPVSLENMVTGTGEKVTFTGTGSTDNVAIVKWTWTFREGGEDVILEGEEVQYTFEEAGEYEVSLTVEDADGNTAVETFTVTVEGGYLLWIVLAVVLVVMALAVVVWMRRK